MAANSFTSKAVFLCAGDSLLLRAVSMSVTWLSLDTTKQVEPGAAVHLTLEVFEPVDLALDLAAAPAVS